MQKVLRTGNSLAVVIPAGFIKILGIRAHDQVRIITKPEKGKLVVEFKGSKQLPLGISSKVDKRR